MIWREKNSKNHKMWEFHILGGKREVLGQKEKPMK